MKRFCGMMPSDCIEITKKYEDKNGLTITIDAGKEGYTIMYADMSTKFADINATAEENLKIALEIATNELGELKETKIRRTCSEC